MAPNALKNRRRTTYLSWGVLLLILALAAFLRLYLMSSQSLWADEMSSLVTAVKPVARLLYDISNEIHPPLYHLALKVWINIFGTSEAGIRSLSALCGIVLVGLTYALGSRLLGWKVGLLAASLSAISPFQIYYSQEARMYMPLATAGALSVYAFIRYLESEDRMTGVAPATRSKDLWLWAGVYVVVNGLGLWLHYSYPIIILMENAVYGLWLLLSWRRGKWLLRGLRWAALQVLAVAIYLPWLPIGYRQLSTWPSISEARSLPFILGEAFRLFSVGESVDVRAVQWTVLGFAVIFLVGLLPINLAPRDGRSRSLSITAYALLVCYVLFPIFMMYGLSLLRPAYRPKFFLVGSAGFSIVMARGIIGPWLKRGLLCRVSSIVWSIVCVVVILMGILPSLQNYYFVPRYARDDYRGIAQYVGAVGKEGEAVLLNAAGQEDVFEYYYEGSLPVYPLPRHRPLSVERTTNELEQIAAQHDKLYTVFWATDESDPHRVIEGWLDAHAYKAMDDWRGNVRLVVYSLPQDLSPSEIEQPVQVRLGDEIALLGFTLQNDSVQGGDIMQITLFWRALKPIHDRYSVFVHLLDGSNHIIGQRDAEPGGGANLTSAWEEGETIVDNYGILIEPGTPPGTYELELGMYRVDNGQRLTVTEGRNSGSDRILLPPIEIQSPEVLLPLDVFAIQHPREQRLGELTLLGYDLCRLGHEHEPEQILHPGDVVHVNLYFRAMESLPDLEIALSLADSRGDVQLKVQEPLGGATYPSSAWRVGEIVRDQHDIPLGPDISPGEYALLGHLTAGGHEQVVDLGSFRVE